MKIHEFQAKDLLRAAGVPVLVGKVATSPAEAAAAFTALGTPICAVKAQIHAGGRGKGQVLATGQRGVELAKTAADAERIARGLLDQTLVTIQTGPAGQTVRKVFVESGCAIDRELYCAILVDRAAGSPVLIASTAGGMDIEEVAAKTPEKILSEPFDPDRGLAGWPGSWPRSLTCPRQRGGTPRPSSAGSARRSSPSTPRSSKSIRSCSPKTARSWPWTPR